MENKLYIELLAKYDQVTRQQAERFLAELLPYITVKDTGATLIVIQQQFQRFVSSALQALETALTQSHKEEVEGLKKYMVHHLDDCDLSKNEVCDLCGNYEDDHCSPDGSCPPNRTGITHQCTCGLDQLLKT